MTGDSGMFISAKRPAGVLEVEDDASTTYFYLYRLEPEPAIVVAIHICSGASGLSEQDFAITWNGTEEMVGFLIVGRLWAYFEVASQLGEGGDDDPVAVPRVPPHVVSSFDRRAS